MLRDIRTDYQKSELSEETIHKKPLVQLQNWLEAAISGKISEPTAMVLSTNDPTGNPDSRVVLLKELTSEGLVFFTNYNSKKGKQIGVNPNVSVVFFWPEPERQVRIKGRAEKISEKDSEAYFLSRPLESQLGAWSSPQSQIIESRNILDENYSHYEEFFRNNVIEKPPHWGGFLIRPEYFEFWQGRSNRLHDRIEYNLSGDKWIMNRLAP
ncbi:MAG: pyridoxamine 5'-phosphate oxidase [Bacteroidota bacterium]|nr:pyridoxamine 5'-phosphate oxidase [Odoribacter sp.]MDP3644005.1 pyridoxamine 5'-phosphate oxidase [Bacteroidota bacterium]